MNNLKRILSLALASVMVLGMMVTGASAAKFTDAEDVTHTAAVDVMAALGVIGGMDDGSFNPNGDVTRAQMAKMITFVLNGGVDPKLGKPITSTFTDTATHWAAEYIEYCANLGIIGGKGNGIFDPEGKVTAAEAAKMMLVTLGFDADIFQLGGANWSKNTMALAQSLRVGKTAANAKTLNLFNEITGIGANTPLNRDQAAQLIYNGIQSNTVLMAVTGVTGGSLTEILGTLTGQTPKYDLDLTGDPLLVTKFKAKVFTGVLDEIDYTPATSTSEAFWTYTLDNVSDDTVNEELNPTEIDASDLYKQTVRVIIDEDEEVIAITTAGNDVASTGVFGGLKKTTVTNEDESKTVTRLDGIKVAGGDASELPLYSTETLQAMAAGTKIDENAWSGKIYDEYKLITNEKGEVACVVVTPVTLATVYNMNTKTMTLAKVGGGSVTATLASDNVEAGLTKGDYVTVTTAKTGVNTVKAADTMTAKVDASRQTSSGTTLRVEGKWYNVASDFSSSSVKITTAAELNNNECNLVLVAGYIVAGAPVEEGIEFSDAVMVVKVASEPTKVPATVDVTATHYLQIRILKADGNPAVINVSGKYGDTYNGDGTTGVTRIDETDSDSVASSIVAGTICTYIEDPKSEGYYLVKEYTGEGEYGIAMTGITSINKGLAYGDIYTANETNGAFDGDPEEGSIRFDKDAKVFVLANNGKYAVLTGAEVNKWAKGTVGYAAKAGSLLLATTSANGFTYVQEGFLNLNEPAIPGQSVKSDTAYGIVTANAARVYDSNSRQYVLTMTIWNGTEEIEVLTTEAYTNAQTRNFTAGTVVTYDDNNDGTISGLTRLTSTNAVTAWDGTDTLKFVKAPSGYAGTEDEFTIGDNTAIVYIDVANRTGAASGAISLAAELLDDDGNFAGYLNNVYVAVAKSDEEALAYIIVDIGNAIGGSNSKTANDIKAMPNGNYTGTEMGPVDEAISAEPLEHLMFFVYTTKTAGTDCEIVVTNESGDEVYKETLEDASAGKHYFVMDLRTGGYNGEDAEATGEMAPGTYTYTISNAVSGATPDTGVFTGTFTIADADDAD